MVNRTKSKQLKISLNELDKFILDSYLARTGQTKQEFIYKLIFDHINKSLKEKP